MTAAIRPGRMSDLDALVAIEQQAFQSDRLSRRSLRRFLAASDTPLLVAQSEGAVLGYALILLRSGSRSARSSSTSARVT